MYRLKLRVTDDAVHQEAAQSFQHIEQEYTARIKQSSRSSSRRESRGFRDYSNITSARSYVKFGKSCYGQEPLPILYRKFIVVDIEDLTVYESATSTESLLSLPITFVSSVIDADDDMLKIVYTHKQAQHGLVIKPFTEEDLNKYAALFRNLALLREFPYLLTGELPVRPRSQSPDQLIVRKPRKTVFWQQPEAAEEESVTEEQPMPKSMDSSLYYVEDSFEDSAEDFENSAQSVYYDLQDDNYGLQDNMRTLTTLAKLNKSEGLVNLLTKGGLFKKFGRWGKPHVRHVLVTSDLRYIEWRPLNRMKPSGSQAAVAVTRIEVGRTTKVFQRFPGNEEASFSLIFTDRSLDLELIKENTVPREVWVQAFQLLLDQQFSRDQVQRFVFKRSMKHSVPFA